jgi:hypothetical protein
MGSWAIEYQLLMQGKPDVKVIATVDRAEIDAKAKAKEAVIFVPFHADEAPDESSDHWRRDGDLYVLSAPRELQVRGARP